MGVYTFYYDLEVEAYEHEGPAGELCESAVVGVRDELVPYGEHNPVFVGQPTGEGQAARARVMVEAVDVPQADALAVKLLDGVRVELRYRADVTLTASGQLADNAMPAEMSRRARAYRQLAGSDS